MRGFFLAWVLGGALASAHAANLPFDIELLDAAGGDAAPVAVASGSLDAQFGAYRYREARLRGGPFWLRLTARASSPGTGAPALAVTQGRHLAVQVFAAQPAGQAGVRRLLPAATLPAFSGVQDVVYALPQDRRVIRSTRGSSPHRSAARKCCSSAPAHSTGCWRREPGTRA